MKRPVVFFVTHTINPDLNLEALSVHFGLTPGYISDMLRKYFGMAFQRRLAWHRVRQAKILLEAF
jgi:YesN/AraC family two-component response regulator